eukprot:Anaeramoba_flamelloidesc32563_g1_i2.p1 GENE.c32563_g1_i2~~c32563_g1_i2.p1  ORF type:complete len:125 (-),score=15.38 c32563_g1_i2:72-446(-)
MSFYFRSEEMQLVQLLIKQETAYPLIKSLGQLSAIQFLDLNAGKPNILRDYHNDVKKFDKLERTVRKFEAVTIGLPEPPKDANYLLQSEDNDNIENGSIDAIEVRTHSFFLITKRKLLKITKKN